MRTLVTATAMTLWVVSVAPVVSADTLVMRDGSRVEGTVLTIAGRTITEMLTKGRAVKTPAETILRFLLDKPVTLRAEG